MKLYMDKEALSLLNRIGLNQYESRTYLALLSNGASSASEISENASIPRPRTYDILQKLSKKGFISTQPGRPVKFKAVNINEAFDSLKNQKSIELNKEITEMLTIASKLSDRIKEVEPTEAESPDMVWVLKSRKNIHSKIDSLINNAKESILLATSENGLERKMKLHEDSLRKASKRGVEITIMTPKKTKHSEKASDFANVVMKQHEHRMLVADDNVVLFLTPEQEAEKEVGAWINSPFFANNAKKMI